MTTDERLTASALAELEKRAGIKPAADAPIGEVTRGHALEQHAADASERTVTTPSPDTENMQLRRLLWLHHGHVGIYGDDGEMQCSQEHILDFKRDPIERLVEGFMTPQELAFKYGVKS